MSVVIPKERPQRGESDLLKIANHFFDGDLPIITVIGIRGYYLNSQGKPNVNDLETYDDAIFTLIRGRLVGAYNANTDPSKTHADMAMLKEGIYQFYKGMHKNKYWAFRAYPEGVKLPCQRQDSHGIWHDSLCQLINIHMGYFNTTGSAGCQTIIKTQFPEFRDKVYNAMSVNAQKTITYLLVSEQDSQVILGG